MKQTQRPNKDVMKNILGVALCFTKVRVLTLFNIYSEQEAIRLLIVQPFNWNIVFFISKIVFKNVKKQERERKQRGKEGRRKELERKKEKKVLANKVTERTYTTTGCRLISLLCLIVSLRSSVTPKHGYTFFRKPVLVFWLLFNGPVRPDGCLY